MSINKMGHNRPLQAKAFLTGHVKNNKEFISAVTTLPIDEVKINKIL
jgi:hypothetical protein